MAFPDLLRNACIALGTIAFVYMMLKIFVNKSNNTSKNPPQAKECKEITEEQSNEITVNSTESKSESVKRKLECNETPMKFFKRKPNFFVAFQVNDAGIHQKIKSLQEKVIERNPLLLPALVNVSTLHITLAVTHLANEKDIKTVKDKLNEWVTKNVKKYFGEPCILNFSGVKTFSNKVAYVDIEQGESYEKISDISKNINNILSSAGFIIDSRGFTPHLTFLKLSKDFKLVKSKKQFRDDFEFLRNCKEHFGTQEISYLQLLSMESPKDEFGYYKCFHQIKLLDAKIDMDHSKCCKPIPEKNFQPNYWG